MDVYELSAVCACSQWNHPRESTRRERCSFIVSGGHQQSRDSDRMSGGGQGTNRGGEFADDKQDMSNQARKVARLQADNSPASQINRPAVDAIAMLLMSIHPIWGAKTAG